MIAVRKTNRGFKRLIGNPVLRSLDGKRKTKLSIILHSSWTPGQRAEYGVYLAKPFVAPEGKRAVGEARFEQGVDGVVREVRDTEDKPKPGPRRDLAAELDDLKVRVAALEDRA